MNWRFSGRQKWHHFQIPALLFRSDQGRDILVQPDFWLLIFGDFREDKPGIPFKKSFPPIPVLNDQSFRKKFVK